MRLMYANRRSCVSVLRGDVGACSQMGEPQSQPHVRPKVRLVKKPELKILSSSLYTNPKATSQLGPSILSQIRFIAASGGIWR
jgi:hypothetical protein